MIKSNTLPELPDIYSKEFKKKEKEKKIQKKYKKLDYDIHINTSNVSFLKMYRNLSVLGIKNNDFFLALYDDRLEDVDPWDEDLSLEEQIMVFNECKNNYWYFIREVVRLPVPGSDIGTGKQYELHRGNLAMSWCFMNNLNFFGELPRQNGKSVAVDLMLLWLYNFGTSNSSMLIMNKDHAEAKNNLKRIREFRDALPSYLQFNTRFNDNGVELKLPQNKEDAFNPKNRNQLITKPCATSKDKADQLGRGMTQPVQWFDEFGFLKYNMIIYESASPAALQASIEAEKLGKPHCKMITTTPGDMATEYGTDAYNFKNKCLLFREEYYDWDIDDVKELLRLNSDNGFFNIVFSWKQLGRTNAYYDQCWQELGGNYLKIRREVLLHWISVTDDSPFDEKDLDALQEITYNEDAVATPWYIDKYYKLNLYDKIDNTKIPVIISCDVSSGARRDFSTIAIINSRTKQCIGEFANNKVDSLTFSYIIHAIATKLFPNCVVVIERNNVGAAVIGNLLRTELKSKLYFESNKSDIQEKIKNGTVEYNQYNDIRNYGLWTDDNKREQMMELLMKFVHTYRDRIRTPILSSQICELTYNKHNRIDHKPNMHDDMVMGYLIGMWVYYYGKNISKYGIVKMPDVDPETGLTEEEAYAKMVVEKEEKEKELAKNIKEMMNSFDTESTGPEFKTIADYYNEIDSERESYYYNDTGNGSVPLSSIVNNKPNVSNNKNRIDLLNPIRTDTVDSIFNPVNYNGTNDFANDILGGILDDDF